MNVKFAKLKTTFGWIGAIKVLLAHAFKSKLISAPLKGFSTSIKFRPYTGDFATIRQVIWDEEYNLDLPAETEYIVDLGANIGISSLALSYQYPAAKIIALEPDKKNFELLTFNTKHYKNIVRLNKAIWSRDEMVSLENPEVKTNSFVFKKMNDSNKSNMVEATAITTLIREFNLPRIDLLKVDIEGIEREIFLQANTDWLNNVNFISIEFHDDKVATDISDLLMALQFSVSRKGEKHLFKNERALLNKYQST